MGPAIRVRGDDGETHNITFERPRYAPLTVRVRPRICEVPIHMPWLLALAVVVMLPALIYWLRRPSRDDGAYESPYPYDEPRSAGGDDSDGTDA
jgi:hypothetical protein